MHFFEGENLCPLSSPNTMGSGAHETWFEILPLPFLACAILGRLHTSASIYILISKKDKNNTNA